VKVLKNKLSEYVRLAASGETVLVTDRDRVVAELGPPRTGRAPHLADALLAEAVGVALARSGLTDPDGIGIHQRRARSRATPLAWRQAVTQRSGPYRWIDQR